MKLVKFTGPMGLPSRSARHLDTETLERLGVEVPDTLLTNGVLVFGPSTNHTVEMSNEASDSLVAALPKEFEIVQEDDNESLVEPLMTSSLLQSGVQNVVNDETDADTESSDDD